MKILLTGFDPFGGESINPAYEVVKRINDNINGAEIIKLEVPTVFYDSIARTIEKIEEIKPDFVINIGQAGGRSEISIERVAINIDDARIPDNKGQQPIDSPINPTGKSAYFATLPIKAIAQSIRDKKIPANVSDSAGTYVCNHLMYGVLDYIYQKNLPIQAGFIHIPFLMEQVLDKPKTASMDLNTLVIAIETAIQTAVQGLTINNKAHQG